MPLIRFAAAMSALCLCAQPCSAAGMAGGAGEARSAAFAGIQLRLPVGDAAARRPTARLQVAAYSHRPHATARGASGARGLELGLGEAGRADIYVAGRKLAPAERKLDAAGSGTTWIIVGGVLLAVLVLAAVAAAQPKPGPGSGDF